jgi:hypothetical protein
MPRISSRPSATSRSSASSPGSPAATASPYLAHLPRVWEHLTRDLAHPGLAPLRTWVAAHVLAPDAAQRARLAAVPA